MEKIVREEIMYEDLTIRSTSQTLGTTPIDEKPHALKDADRFTLTF